MLYGVYSIELPAESFIVMFLFVNVDLFIFLEKLSVINLSESHPTFVTSFLLATLQSTYSFEPLSIPSNFKIFPSSKVI